MKHIQSVVIENFQSHAYSRLVLTNGLNVIVGPSDHGKSAILRAISWALFNEPRGTDFVRVGTRTCRVSVTMSHGAEITRECLLSRSGSSPRHRYTVSFPGQPPQTFEGFGADVPAEVLNAHGMRDVALDTDKRVSLNVGSQLEGPFLLTESGPTRAKAIGRLFGVHVVDAAVRDAQRDIRSRRSEASRLHREVERLDEALQGYADLPDQEQQMALADDALLCAEGLNSKADRLAELRDRLQGIDDETNRFHKRFAGLAALPGAEELVGRAIQTTERLAKLMETSIQWYRLAERQAESTHQLAMARQSLQDGLSSLETIIVQLGRCPTCGQKLTRETAKELAAELAGSSSAVTHTHMPAKGLEQGER